MKRGLFSLEQQIAVLFAALSVGLVVIALVATSYFGRREAVRGIEAEITTVANHFAGALDRGMFERFREIRNLAGLEPLRSSWRSEAAAVRAAFDRRQATLPELAWIGFATPDGVVRAATRGMLEGASVAQRPWFQEGLRKPWAGDLHEAKLLAPMLGQPPRGEPFRFVDVTAPVIGDDGSVVGVVGAHLSWTWAHDVRSELLGEDAGTDLQALILSGDGSVLLGPQVGTKPFSDDQIAVMKSEKQGSFQSPGESGTVLNGYAIASGYRDYPGLGWIIVAQRPAAAAFSRVEETSRWVLLIGLGVAALGILIAWRLGRRLTRPIRALTQAAGRIGRDPHANMPRLTGSREIAELSASLRALIRHVDAAERQVQAVSADSVRTSRQFEQEISKLRSVADSDPLTGLLNRRAFLTVAEDATNYYKRYGRNFAILFADIDHFKRVNDTHGHAIGDAVIKHVGAILCSLVRTTDKVARFGGEEFVVLLREIGEEDVRALAERMRRSIKRDPLRSDGEIVPISISIGCALASEGDRDIHDVIERADRALYDAKESGRNRVVMAHAAQDARRAA